MVIAYSLNEDEIIRDWSISKRDRNFISKFNRSYRLWIYLQLCALKLFGQLLEDLSSINGQIIAYACQNLQLNPVVTVSAPNRDATRSEHKKLLFEHLKYSKFETSRKLFHDWMLSKASSGMITYEQL